MLLLNAGTQFQSQRERRTTSTLDKKEDGKEIAPKLPPNETD
jgi:hypothetical protein